MKNIAVLFIVLVISACAHSPSAVNEGHSAYRFQKDDILKLSLFEEKEFNGNYKIDSGGSINLPLAGRISVRNLTEKQAASRIETTLKRKGIFQNPVASIELHSSKPIFVLGEVNRAGQFIYQPDMIIYQAVAQAGGYSYRADRRDITIHRAQAHIHATENSPIYPGDTIEIGERFF